MTMSRLPLVIGLTLVVTFGLFFAQSLAAPDPQARGIEFFNDMANSPAYKAQSPNPNFDDGMTERTPPPGSIARGFLPMDSGTESVARAARMLGIDSGAAERDTMLAMAVKRGGTVFKNICSPCHGLSALGDGMVTKRGFPPPPSLLAEQAVNLSDGEMFHAISQGRRNMPALPAQVDRDDRWKVIVYIRSLQDGSTNSKSKIAATGGDRLHGALTTPNSSNAAAPADTRAR